MITVVVISGGIKASFDTELDGWTFEGDIEPALSRQINDDYKQYAALERSVVHGARPGTNARQTSLTLMMHTLSKSEIKWNDEATKADPEAIY